MEEEGETKRRDDDEAEGLATNTKEGTYVIILSVIYPRRVESSNAWSLIRGEGSF